MRHLALAWGSLQNYRPPWLGGPLICALPKRSVRGPGTGHGLAGILGARVACAGVKRGAHVGNLTVNTVVVKWSKQILSLSNRTLKLGEIYSNLTLVGPTDPPRFRIEIRTSNLVARP